MGSDQGGRSNSVKRSSPNSNVYKNFESNSRSFALYQQTDFSNGISNGYRSGCSGTRSPRPFPGFSPTPEGRDPGEAGG